MGKFVCSVCFAVLVATLLTPSPATAQTDIALSGYAAFNSSTSGSLINQFPSDQGGLLIEARHIANPLFGLEGTYAFNRANQSYRNTQSVCNLSACSNSSANIRATAHELTADWIVSIKLLNVRPFALAGGGLLINKPSGGTETTLSCALLNPLCLLNTTSPTTQTQVKGEFTYGAGLDWTIIPHLGIRLQYRGRVYKAPQLVTAFSSTNQFMRTAQPAAGIFLRF
jgi:opacity protein-like surface antigen